MLIFAERNTPYLDGLPACDLRCFITSEPAYLLAFGGSSYFGAGINHGYSEALGLRSATLHDYVVEQVTDSGYI